MIKRLKRKYILIVMLAVIIMLGGIIAAINLLSYSAVNSQLDEKLTMLIENEGEMPDFPPPEIPKFEDEEEEGKDEVTDTDDPTDPDNGDSSDESDGQKPPSDGTDTDVPGNTDGTDDTGTGDADDGDGEKEPSADDGTNGGDGSDVTEDGEEGTSTEDPEDGKEESGKEEEEDIRQNMSPETPFETRYFSVKLNTDGIVTGTNTAKVVAVDDALAERYAKKILAEKKECGYISTYRYMRSETDNGYICVFIDANRELESFHSFLLASLIISALGILAVLLLVILLSETALKPIIESYEKQKRFITDAGHEMKTPLTVISANAEIIELENGESQWISGIKSQVAKLASLTEKLVILSKMEEGAKLEMNGFSLSEALFDTCNQYESISMSRGVRFNLSIGENITMVGNEGEIRRCVSLLLDNAFRYVDEGGEVEVRAQRFAGGVEIGISNTTEGVDKGSLDRWFDRFYRTDLSRNSATGGSGIGLSVVKAIVLAHGGAVKAFSPDGVKVEFTITI